MPHTKAGEIMGLSFGIGSKKFGRTSVKGSAVVQTLSRDNLGSEVGCELGSRV